MERREEGEALTASVCAKTETHDALLEVLYVGEQVNVRYIHAPGRGAEEFGPKRDFLFITNKARRALFMTFEGLDGAFTAYLDKEHPLFEMLMTGSSLSIEDPTRRVDSRMLRLKGSREAIEKVLAGCTAPPTLVAEPASCGETPADVDAATPPASPAGAETPTAPGDGARPRTSDGTNPSADKR